MANKILVVFGATGNQGGSVVRSILGDAKTKQEWSVRAITRDVSKPSAQALATLGAEVVTADLDKPETLSSALKDAYAVFAVTNFWESLSASKEVAQGTAIADAAKAAGVEHFIWSSLPNVTKETNGVLKNVSHFDSKAAVADHVREIGLPHTFFNPGVFITPFPGASFRLGPNNTWVLALPLPPDSQIPALVPDCDVGKFVKGILANRASLLGKDVLGASEYITPAQIVQQFKERFPKAGVDAQYVQQTQETFMTGLGAFGVAKAQQLELAENFRFVAEFGYYQGRGLEESHKIVTEPLTTWKDYLDIAPAFKGLE